MTHTISNKYRNTFSFDKYVCVGDTSTIEREGYVIRATIKLDGDTSPDEFECYSKEEKARWLSDEWFYCGVVLSISYNMVELNDHAASLWGVECNIGTHNDYLVTVAEDLIYDALEVGKATRTDYLNRLQDKITLED